MTSGRIIALIVGVILEFAAVAAILLTLIPPPHASVDFLVVGTLATFISLATIFGIMMATRKNSSVPKPEDHDAGPKGS